MPSILLVYLAFFSPKEPEKLYKKAFSFAEMQGFEGLLLVNNKTIIHRKTLLCFNILINFD